MKLLNLYVIVSPVGRRVGGKLYAKQKLPIYFVNRLYRRVVIYLRSARVSAKRSREIAEGATAVSSPGHGNPHTNSSGSTVPKQAVKELDTSSDSHLFYTPTKGRRAGVVPLYFQIAVPVS